MESQEQSTVFTLLSRMDGDVTQFTGFHLRNDDDHCRRRREHPIRYHEQNLSNGTHQQQQQYLPIHNRIYSSSSSSMDTAVMKEVEEYQPDIAANITTFNKNDGKGLATPTSSMHHSHHGRQRRRPSHTEDESGGIRRDSVSRQEERNSRRFIKRRPGAWSQLIILLSVLDQVTLVRSAPLPSSFLLVRSDVPSSSPSQWPSHHNNNITNTTTTVTNTTTTTANATTKTTTTTGTPLSSPRPSQFVVPQLDFFPSSAPTITFPLPPSKLVPVTTPSLHPTSFSLAPTTHGARQHVTVAPTPSVGDTASSPLPMPTAVPTLSSTNQTTPSMAPGVTPTSKPTTLPFAPSPSRPSQRPISFPQFPSKVPMVVGTTSPTHAVGKTTTTKPTSLTPTSTKPTSLTPTSTKPTSSSPTSTKPTASIPTSMKPTIATSTSTKPSHKPTHRPTSLFGGESPSSAPTLAHSHPGTTWSPTALWTSTRGSAVPTHTVGAASTTPIAAPTIVVQPSKKTTKRPTAFPLLFVWPPSAAPSIALSSSAPSSFTTASPTHSVGSTSTTPVAVPSVVRRTKRPTRRPTTFPRLDAPSAAPTIAHSDFPHFVTTTSSPTAPTTNTVVPTHTVGGTSTSPFTILPAPTNRPTKIPTKVPQLLEAPSSAPSMAHSSVPQLITRRPIPSSSTASPTRTVGNTSTNPVFVPITKSPSFAPTLTPPSKRPTRRRPTASLPTVFSSPSAAPTLAHSAFVTFSPSKAPIAVVKPTSPGTSRTATPTHGVGDTSTSPIVFPTTAMPSLTPPSPPPSKRPHLPTPLLIPLMSPTTMPVASLTSKPVVTSTTKPSLVVVPVAVPTTAPTSHPQVVSAPSAAPTMAFSQPTHPQQSPPHSPPSSVVVQTSAPTRTVMDTQTTFPFLFPAFSGLPTMAPTLSASSPPGPHHSPFVFPPFAKPTTTTTPHHLSTASPTHSVAGTQTSPVPLPTGVPSLVHLPPVTRPHRSPVATHPRITASPTPSGSNSGVFPFLLPTGIPTLVPSVTPPTAPANRPQPAPVTPHVHISPEPTHRLPTGLPTISAVPQTFAAPSPAPTIQPPFTKPHRKPSSVTFSPSAAPTLVLFPHPRSPSTPSRATRTTISPTHTIAEASSAPFSIPPQFAPSLRPQQKPTLPATHKPSSPPSLAPVETASPSAYPTIQHRATPRYDLQTLLLPGARMQLYGALPVNTQARDDWLVITKDRIAAEVVAILTGNLESVNVVLNITTLTPPLTGRRRLIGVSVAERQQVQTITLLIVFDVTIFLRSALITNPQDLMNYVGGGFSTPQDLANYLMALRSTNETAFADVYNLTLSLPFITSVNGGLSNNGGSNNAGLIAGLVVASIVTAAALALFFYLRRQPRVASEEEKEEIQPASETAAAPNSSNENEITSEINLDLKADVSTLGDPIGPNVVNGGPDHSVADTFSLDFDFQRAYHRNDVTSGSESNDSNPNMMVLKDDDTFDLQYYSHEQFEVDAPEGMLGLVLETSADGVPVVHAIKHTSPIVDQVRPGDRLLSVDGEDVTIMLASDVSRLISSKRDNPIRRFVFSRLPDNDNHVVANDDDNSLRPPSP